MDFFCPAGCGGPRWPIFSSRREVPAISQHKISDRSMKLNAIAAALAATTLAANAATIVASSSFEAADGFVTTTGNKGGINVTASNDSAAWLSGTVGVNYNSVWTGQALTGTRSAVIGNVGQWMTVDPSGAAGVGTVSFSWERYTASTGNFEVQWTIDVINGGETWTTAAAIDKTGSVGVVWKSEVIAINQPGDVKVRWINTTGTGGQSFDDVSITAVPEPSSAALLGLVVSNSYFDGSCILHLCFYEAPLNRADVCQNLPHQTIRRRAL